MTRPRLLALTLSLFTFATLGCGTGVVRSGKSDGGGGAGGGNGGAGGGGGGAGGGSGGSGGGGAAGAGGSGGGAGGAGGGSGGGSGGTGGAGGADGGAKDVPPGSWTDPYPPMPPMNDPGLFPNDAPGGLVEGVHEGPRKIRYRLVAPKGADTSTLPLIVTTTVYIWDHAKSAVVLALVGPDASKDGAYYDYIESLGFSACSPSCSMLKLLGGDNLKTLLTDVAKTLRFDHKRVIMMGDNECSYPISLALREDIQPFFAGATCLWSEWQMAVCPSAATAKVTSASPKVFHGVGKCDHSFCPQMACYESVKSGGFDVSIAQDATYSTCPCPPPGGSPGSDRPHALGESASVRAAHTSFIFSTKRP